MGSFILPIPGKDPSIIKTPSVVPSSGARHISPAGKFPKSPFSRYNPVSVKFFLIYI